MAQTGAYTVEREGEDIILRIAWDESPFIPSIEDRYECMSRVIEILTKIGIVTKIIFHQRRDYEYDYEQSKYLVEIAKIYTEFIREKIDPHNLGEDSCPSASACRNRRYAQLSPIIYKTLKEDPVGAYVALRRIQRREILIAENSSPAYKPCQDKYVFYITDIIRKLEETKLIHILKNKLTGFHIGNRTIYRELFHPVIRPDFMYTKLMAQYPPAGIELSSYKVDDADITIFQQPDLIQTLYHVIPPEFKLSEEKYSLLDNARAVLAEHKPTKDEFTNPARLREVFSNVGLDLLEELANKQRIKLSLKELRNLTKILVRYTIGFGLIEVMLSDEQVQDVTINSPMGRAPFFIVHGEFDDCSTNIIPMPTEAESWASKLRLISGRPLDEANPILDTELELPGATARIAVIGPPLNPSGLAYAFRRHRDRPWTLPLFVKRKFVNPLGAGLLSFLVDGARTMLIAGTRSAGKTSLLSSLMIEILRRKRIITIEDTLELPTRSMKDLGYNIQSMKVASSLSRGTAEVSAAEGIRTTLRLGDSALIVGEIRSDEARALYEAMRVGALANVVAGTIHGDSPYGVYDRVVNDLNVPRTSFKATDIVVVANPLRSPGGIGKIRRVTSITEIRKDWEEDPLREHGFVDLMKYDPKTDQLEPTQDLLNGDSEVMKSIAGRTKEWAGNWDAVWENVNLRMRIKQAMVDIADRLKNPEIMEANFSLKANDRFHLICEDIEKEVGHLDSERIFLTWHEWLKREAQKVGQ